VSGICPGGIIVHDSLLSKVLWPGHIVAGRVDRQLKRFNTTRFYTEIGAGVSSTGYEPYPAHDQSGRWSGKACDWGPRHMPVVILRINATSWDNGCQKLTPFLTPVAPRRARDRVPSILALGLFLAVSDFTQPETAPLSFHIPVVTKPQVQSENGAPPFLHFWQRDAVDRRAWPI
jgi:hypothetical protein